VQSWNTREIVGKKWLLNTQTKLVKQGSMVIAAGFMKAKRCVCQHDEDETAATDETPSTDETHNEDRWEEFYKECFFNYENCTSGECFRIRYWLQIHWVSRWTLYLQSTTHFNSNRFPLNDSKKIYSADRIKKIYFKIFAISKQINIIFLFHYHLKYVIMSMSYIGQFNNPKKIPINEPRE
jgi:hypothetical protein